MGSSRREFDNTTSAATAAIPRVAAVPSAALAAADSAAASPTVGDPDMKDFAPDPLDAAPGAGASSAAARHSLPLVQDRRQTNGEHKLALAVRHIRAILVLPTKARALPVPQAT